MESLEGISISGPYTRNKDGATGSYYGKFTEEEIEELPGLEGNTTVRVGKPKQSKILVS